MIYFIRKDGTKNLYRKRRNKFMNTSKTKKGLSVLLAIIMLFSTLSTAFTTLAAEKAYPVMEKFTAASSTEFHAYYGSIYSATFLDRIDWDDINASYQYWDSSENNDNSVIAYIKLNAEQTELAGTNRYDLYIAGDGGVGANPDSGFIFYFFSALEEVRGCENFKTSNTTSFNGMFYECKKLRSVTGIDWDTSNVTDMSYMFRNCHELTELDLSSFDTSKVTTMKYMFYYCEKLEHIYVGDGWTTESIANLNDGVFNCCYAIVGGKEIYNENFQYFPPSAEYAKLKEDGGFLTYKLPDVPETYTVTYEFIGDVIPENVTAPEQAIYDEGTTVTVATDASAEGYIFSGWSTDDAEIKDGKFTLNNDVHFVGSWEKLYKVEYRYTEGYAVPEGAPALPAAVYYKAGDDVDVFGIPYVDRHIFIGWTTSDADIFGDMFTMPENDVVIYGYFKIPVESVEFMSEDVTLDKDGKTKLNVYVKPEDATIKDLVYESSDETVATVDKYGNITAVGEGTATITVASKDDPTKSDTMTVTVKVPATEIKVDKTEITIREDGTDKVTATVNPDATNKEVTYESSDETVVKVDENGNIEAVGDGEAVITVKSKDNPDLKAEVKVTVKNPVTEITSVEDFTITLDEEKNLEAKVNDDATNKELIYESSNPGVVKVNSDGSVVGVGEGTSIITITSKDDPSITTTVTVTVVPRQYEVTYEFIGEIQPENVTAPAGAVYDEGTTVTVEADASAEGYIFSGWTTENAEVEDGKFTLNNDVHFVGSWTKLYKVTYEYEGEVPAEAPELPAAEKYTAGKEVDVKAVPSVDGYTFTGWYTSDATVEDGKFTMPEKDVVLKGKFEKIINYYNVEYKYEGDVPAGAPTYETKTYEEGTNVIVEGNPSVDGYTFSGWTTADADIASGNFDVYNNVVIIGKWTKNPVYYNVEYKYEGEVPADAPTYATKTYEEGTNVIVEAEPSVDGYTFSGWTTADADITDGNFNIYNNVVIIGKWTKNSVYYNVEYKYEGDVPAGAPTYATKTYEEGSNVIVEGNPSVDGYTFSGWTTADADIASGNFDIYNNVVIIGSWTKNPVYYNVEYKYEGDVPADAPTYETKTYEEGTTVTVEAEPSVDGYKFLGWSKNGAFVINNNVVIVGKWEKLPGPVTEIIAPEKITVVLGEEKMLEASVNTNAVNKSLYYMSNNESVVKIDENGKITTVGEGTALITVASVENPSIYKVVEVTVTAKPAALSKHYIVFGKTEKIGWYSVSLDGGKTFFTQFGNDHLEVEKGTEIIVKANDVFGDPFTFYVNGNAVTPDENGYVRILVNDFILIGALGIPVVAPDAEESLNFIQKFIKAIKDFFAKIAAFFKF